MLELLHRFLRWLLKLLGGDDQIASSKETPAEVETSPRPRTAFATPELGMASSEPPRYRKSESLFSYRERVFYRALLEAVSDEYQVFAKVRMADFVYLANEPGDRKFYLNQILCKHVDFLLCAREAQKPLLAIELDDRSHRKYDRQERDEFKEKTLSSVGLPWLRVPLQPQYSVPELSDQIRGAIQGNIVK